jgi:dienelactone hydrolase
VYEPFPGNYWWSVMVSNALGMGGEMAEIDPLVRRLREAADGPIGRRERAVWATAWHELGLEVAARAERDAEQGLRASARRKFLRAAAYMFVGEVVDSAHDGDPGRLAVYHDAQEAFRRGIELERHPVRLVEVPFEGRSLPAVYVPAHAGTEPAPCMVHFDGKDDVKEVTYLRHRHGLAERGIGLLIVDHPGSGQAVRERGMVARPDIETAAAACVDHLEARPEVDPQRIGIIAQSFGGYYAPRSAAMEPRLSVCVVWGAIWDAAAVVAETGAPVEPSGWGLLGPLEDEDAVRRRLAAFTLEDVIDRLTCPLLVLHGANDRQVPLWTAERTVERAINAASTELRVFDAAEHGDEHCQVDLFTQATDFIADWLDRFFTENHRPEGRTT